MERGKAGRTEATVDGAGGNAHGVNPHGNADAFSGEWSRQPGQEGCGKERRVQRQYGAVVEPVCNPHGGAMEHIAGELFVDIEGKLGNPRGDQRLVRLRAFGRSAAAGTS